MKIEISVDLIKKHLSLLRVIHSLVIFVFGLMLTHPNRFTHSVFIFYVCPFKNYTPLPTVKLFPMRFFYWPLYTLRRFTSFLQSAIENIFLQWLPILLLSLFLLLTLGIHYSSIRRWNRWACSWKLACAHEKTPDNLMNNFKWLSS
jgi:hypothetical protein